MKENKMAKKCKNVVGKKTWPTPKKHLQVPIYS
jgi:hypothetical protein